MKKAPAPRTRSRHTHEPRAAVDLPPDTRIEQAARLLRALGDGERLKLLVLLAQREWCVTELAAAQGQTLATLSQRIRVLRNEHIVTRRRDGRHINYALADKHIVELIRNALDHAGEAQHPARKTRKP